jgi:CTP synthase
LLSHLHGILVPGGFGIRGAEGKITTIRYARENKVPYLGLCYGMQLAVVEFARNVAGLTQAQSEEFNITPCDPVIYLMRQWFDYRLNAVINRDQDSDLGGTMRLGAYPCVLVEGSLAAKAYGHVEIFERHRHRYEFNNDYRDRLVEAGLGITGTSPNGELVEIIEIPDHPWFLGCQFHPEFKSRPQAPHPLFRDYVGACAAYKRSTTREGTEI